MQQYSERLLHGWRRVWGNKEIETELRGVALSRSTHELAGHVRTPGPTRRIVAHLLAITASTATLVGAQVNATDPPFHHPSLRSLTIDDVLAIETIGETVLSPDGAWVAAVIQRPRTVDERYQRINLESRADVWLIRTDGGTAVNLTKGAAEGRGYWSPRWSPSGRRLAMVGTQGRTAVGVQLYVWQRRTQALSRVSSRPLDVGFTVVGGPLGRDAPFGWLNDTTLFAPLQPSGYPGWLAERNVGLFNRIRDAWHRAEHGRESTVSLLESGVEPLAPSGPQVDLTLIHLVSGGATTVGAIPRHCVFCQTRLDISPNRRRLAVMDQTAWVPYRADDPGNVRPGTMIGMLELDCPASVTWTAHPMYWASPLGWSPDNATFAVWAKADPWDRRPRQLMLVEPKGRIVSIALPAKDISDAVWASDRSLLVYAGPAAPQTAQTSRWDWWRITVEGETVPTNMTATLTAVPSQLRWTDTNTGVGIAGGRLWSLNVRTGEARNILPEGLGPVASLTITPDLRGGLAGVVVTDTMGQLYEVRPGQPTWSATAMAGPGYSLTAYDATSRSAVFSQVTSTGTFVRSWQGQNPHRLTPLLKRNEHLAGIADAASRLIDYQANGQTLRAIALLPPGYDPARRYPTIVWVYQGTVYRDTTGVRGISKNDDSVLNLQLLAAHGYVVLLPSMPMPAIGVATDPYRYMLPGVFPAIDELVRRGIADSTRLGLMGHSGGGYTVNAIITLTNRFRAAVSLAGIADLVSFYGAFDLGDRYGDELGTRRSGFVEGGQFHMGVPPWVNPQRYVDNSPLFHLSEVETPLLIISGDVDAHVAQSEELFAGLYRLGKRARFARFPGEDHVLDSPANVREMWRQIYDWFDECLADSLVPTAPPGSSLGGNKAGRDSLTRTTRPTRDACYSSPS
jgi:dipeptidyl aminopeptidase/acylaminoacyl peptidase